MHQVTAESLELHYHSPRHGFGGWVVGLCEEVARAVFKHWVHFRLVEGRQATPRQARATVGDHEVGVPCFCSQPAQGDRVVDLRQ